MENRNKFISLIFSFIIILCGLFAVVPVRADYVLPYPSYMPGNKLYRLSRIIDALNKYWYFGNIAQVKYHMGLSDKYLVEAKTLFEYDQYLLADDALERSNNQFVQIMPYVVRAQKEGKDMSQFITSIHEESFVHKKLLEQLISETPEEFSWQPEKQNATILYLHRDLEEAIALR